MSLLTVPQLNQSTTTTGDLPDPTNNSLLQFFNQEYGTINSNDQTNNNNNLFNFDFEIGNIDELQLLNTYTVDDMEITPSSTSTSTSTTPSIIENYTTTQNNHTVEEDMQQMSPITDVNGNVMIPIEITETKTISTTSTTVTKKRQYFNPLNLKKRIQKTML